MFLLRASPPELPRIEADDIPLFSGRLISEHPAINRQLQKTRQGEIPAFVISAEAARNALNVSMAPLLGSLMLGTGCVESTVDQILESGQTDLALLTIQSCFKMVGELLGPTPDGRSFLAFQDVKKRNDGRTHTDDFDGLTMHIQGSVIEDRHRLATFGMRSSQAPETQGMDFDTVQSGATDKRPGRASSKKVI